MTSREFHEGDPPPDHAVRDRYGRRWTPETGQDDRCQGWVHRPADGLAPHWTTWGQLTIQRAPLTDDDPVAVLCDRMQRAMDLLAKHPDYDTGRDWRRWNKLDSLLCDLLGNDCNPATDEPARLIARVLLGEDVAP